MSLTDKFGKLNALVALAPPLPTPLPPPPLRQLAKHALQQDSRHLTEYLMHCVLSFKPNLCMLGGLARVRVSMLSVC